jgi:hypothetical protein
MGGVKRVKNNTNRILSGLFAALIAVNLLYLLLGFASIPAYYERVTRLSIPNIEAPGFYFPSNESVAQAAAAQGLTLVQYAVVQIIYHSAIVLISIVVAAVVMLRAGQNWYAWYSAFFMVFIAEYAFYNEVYIAHLLPLWVYEAGSLFWPLILLYFFLFPNGKPVPRKALWVILPVFILHGLFQTAGFFILVFPEAAGRSALDGISDPFQAGILFVFLFILGCQLYRYVRVSTYEEKLQTKWFLVGFAMFLSLSTVSDLIGEANPIKSEIGLLIFIFVPLSLGIAILRYRLFDIDVLIRKTLVYGVLTAMLALVFFGGVALLQQIFGRLSGTENSPVAIVLSTIAIVAISSPLRRRVQDFIDRRFYRQKYNAEKALAEFAATARTEANLEQISERLVGTVHDTMRPQSVSLWLPNSNHETRSS